MNENCLIGRIVVVHIMPWMPIDERRLYLERERVRQERGYKKKQPKDRELKQDNLRDHRFACARILTPDRQEIFVNCFKYFYAVRRWVRYVELETDLRPADQKRFTTEQFSVAGFHFYKAADLKGVDDTYLEWMEMLCPAAAQDFGYEWLLVSFQDGAFNYS